MSSHSRSSSEILILKYRDILPMFLKSFKSDFDFDDVKDDVKHLFSKEEYQELITERDETRRLVLLFWILCSNEKTIPQFLENIRQHYEFLTEPIKKERDYPSKQTLIYVEKVHLLRSSYPKHTDFNVLRLDMHIRLRQALRKLDRFHSVILQGDLGMGKKWLTISVCYDFEVLKAMDFEIYWIDVKGCKSPEQDLNRLQTLDFMLGAASGSNSPTFTNGASNGFVSAHQESTNRIYNETIMNLILKLQQSLRNLLSSAKHRNCLVILKDVENVKTLGTFNKLGCKLLVITRNKKIYQSLSPTMSTLLTIDNGLTPCEFYALFEKYLEQPREKFPKNAFDIYEHSNGNPYLLSIIAQNLRQKKWNWHEWIRNLQSLEIGNEKSLEKAAEISLRELPDEFLKLYATLSVFPHPVLIPIKLLAALWNKSLHDANDIVHRFHTYSFVNKVPCNADNDTDFCCCVVPYIYTLYLRSKYMKSLINSDELHHKVIKYYKIDHNLTQCSEIGLSTGHCDQYFFSCIGYHLHEARRDELFPVIYLDFGFLDQKIRAVGLSNTIGDLKKFGEEITRCDYNKNKLLEEMLQFLPQVEEKLIESRDTSLLQCALMASGLVNMEATRQICQFPNRVWFNEHGSFHKRRHIISLMFQAKFIRLLDQDMCLIVSTNGKMLLLDFSIDCPMKPILFEDIGDSKNPMIKEARLFREDNFILTLDAGHVLKVWSITENHRRSLVHRRSSRQKASSHNYHQSNHKMEKRSCKQRINVNSMGQHGAIVAFFIEQLPSYHDNETILHVAFNNGDICVYKWNSSREEFIAAQIPILETKSTDIRFLSKVLNTYYMLLSKSGKICFWNLRDSSKSYVPFDWPKDLSGPLSYEQIFYKVQQTFFTRTIFVFHDKVMSLTFEQKDFSKKPDAEVEVIYENDSDYKSAITCAKLSDDQHFLVLGTKCGLIVYDMDAKSEVLRSNVSDTIVCVDIYALDDKIFKYVIICGAEKRKSLYICAVRTNDENGITWAHNVTSMGNKSSSDPQLEADVWLLGQKLYDINYKDDGSTLLVAVDSKYRVHQVNTTENPSWTIIMPRETSEEITSITTGKELSFVGYKNGEIYNISNDAFEKVSIKESITYLQIIDDRHLITSTKNQTNISNVGTTNGAMKTYDFSTKRCYKFQQKYLLLINETGKFTLIENTTDGYEQKLQVNGLCEFLDTLCGCDFQNDYLCMTSTAIVKIYYLYHQGSTPKADIIVNEPIVNTSSIIKTTISCVALSRDAGVLAIGYNNGDIEIYKIKADHLDFRYHLQSHRSSIYYMIFSPCNKVLVSSSEQLCFWDMQYVLNNQLIKNSPKRRSSRFSSQHSHETEEVDAKMVLPHANFMSIHSYEQSINDVLNGRNDMLSHAVHGMHGMQLTTGDGAKLMSSAWRDKQGPADKPELLSCIKFDGRKAEKLFANSDFTQFNTIDDEGVYYHLVLLNVTEEQTTASVDVARVEVLDTASSRFVTSTDDSSFGEDEVYV